MKNSLPYWSLAFLLTVSSCAKPVQSPAPGATTSSTGTATPAPIQGSIYQMDMTLENQRGERVSWPSLQGKVRVMAMLFTHCQAACPEIAMDIKRSAELLGSVPSSKLEYTLISFDSKNDTPARLAQYAKEMGMGDNWLLLHGNQQDVQTISSLLDVKFKPMPNGLFSHQNIIVVVDSSGQVVLRREGIGKAPKEIADKVHSLL